METSGIDSRVGAHSGNAATQYGTEGLSDRVKKRRHTFEGVPRNYGPGPVMSHSIEFTFLWSSGRAT